MRGWDTRSPMWTPGRILRCSPARSCRSLSPVCAAPHPAQPGNCAGNFYRDILGIVTATMPPACMAAGPPRHKMSGRCCPSPRRARYTPAMPSCGRPSRAAPPNTTPCALSGWAAGGQDANRDLTLRITDPALLSATGGIVQGMSGSPLVQDGKLVGAVTHVLVGTPQKDTEFLLIRC